ncbi:hypothetical protein ACXX82_19565 [Glaciimonas sp. GNP009]
MTDQTKARPFPLLCTSIFTEVWPAQPDADMELTLRMESLAFSANGGDSGISTAIFQLQHTFKKLFDKVGFTHFLQVAYQQELADGTPIVDTLNALNAEVSAELDKATIDLGRWAEGTKLRFNEKIPFIFAAGDLKEYLERKIYWLQGSIRFVNEGRQTSVADRYREAGLTDDEISRIGTRSPVPSAELMTLGIEELKNKIQHLSDFINDAPHYQVEKLHGIELPNLGYHQANLERSR